MIKQLLNWSTRLMATASILLGIATVSKAGGFPKTIKPPPKIIYTAIASVDATAMTITTETRNGPAGKPRSYKISPKVKVTISGQPKTVADLKPGMQIRVGAGMNAEVAEELSASKAPEDPPKQGHR